MRSKFCSLRPMNESKMVTRLETHSTRGACVKITWATTPASSWGGAGSTTCISIVDLASMCSRQVARISSSHSWNWSVNNTRRLWRQMGKLPLWSTNQVMIGAEGDSSSQVKTRALHIANSSWIMSHCSAGIRPGWNSAALTLNVNVAPCWTPAGGCCMRAMSSKYPGGSFGVTGNWAISGSMWARMLNPDWTSVATTRWSGSWLW